jgi:hypothetical protein
MRLIHVKGEDCGISSVGSRLSFLQASILVALLCIRGNIARALDPNISDRIGIDVHVDSNGAMLDKVRDAGIGWVRVDFDWYQFEPSKGNFNWSTLDAVVAQARSRGLKIYPSIGYTPVWATDGDVRTGVPRNANDWSSAVSAAVGRYKNDIHYWGIWNEPNTTSFWTGTRQQFIDTIVKPGADAIHAADPSAKVLGPELATFFSSGRVWYRWMEDMLAQAGDKIDIISHHTYPRPLSASYTTLTGQLNNDTLVGTNPSAWGFLGIQPSVREVLTGLDWSGPVWLTEFGWPLSDVSEQQVAANYTGIFNDWLTGNSDRNWIDKMFLYHSEPDDYGIFNPDGTPRLAYYAIDSFVVSQIPEPSSIALLVCALITSALALAVRRHITVYQQGTRTSSTTAAAV